MCIFWHDLTLLGNTFINICLSKKCELGDNLGRTGCKEQFWGTWTKSSELPNTYSFYEMVFTFISISSIVPNQLLLSFHPWKLKGIFQYNSMCWQVNAALFYKYICRWSYIILYQKLKNIGTNIWKLKVWPHRTHHKQF